MRFALAILVVALHAQHELGSPTVGLLLEDAVGQIGETINELRELANGVRPASTSAALSSSRR